ncbi:hypothetical protein EV672_105237 [Aquabacterium commune]|uniref:Uncharacterized protein n=1 Tax=Aquabacterium commune TaxID=70586 RepID=A0A4R6RAD3_9BURK|nr:hypothetical protein [Aquabacterium commune]TDP83050.1 hypothetical protein EV672_105237 [Aquabacterium commune]
MRKFWYITGELAELQRYINVPMRWCEQYPARERREFWIAADDGRDIKLIVHGRVMPARRGHQVNVLLLGDWVVGLANLTTGRQVNFVSEDPPMLLRKCDALAVLVILAGGLAAAVAWDVRSLVLTVPVVLMYLPLRVLGRWLTTCRLRWQVSHWLASMAWAPRTRDNAALALPSRTAHNVYSFCLKSRKTED